jgi:hypothetical protein
MHGVGQTVSLIISSHRRIGYHEEEGRLEVVVVARRRRDFVHVYEGDALLLPVGVHGLTI